MKTDISSVQDIRQLMEVFYDKVKQDALLSPFFGQNGPIDWEKHFSVMTSFWENVLFYNGTYQGNPLQIHRHLHKSTPFDTTHFKQWLFLFTSTVDELFEGNKSEQIKEVAVSVARVIEFKLFPGEE